MTTSAKWSLQDTWVLIISLAALLTPIVITELSVMGYTKGVFAYPLDDTFIHMAIAKNLAFHHVWGISSGEFASASSSIMETLLLAGVFKIFGAATGLPFVLNLITAIIFLIVVQVWLKKQGISPLAQILILLALIFFTPLPILVISGMEHTMHCLFSFLFIFSFSGWLAKTHAAPNDQAPAQSVKMPWHIYLYAALVAATRYESAFMIMSALLLLLYYRKIFTAVKLGFFAGLPIVIFGIYSIAKGSYFIPASALLKSDLGLSSIRGIIIFATDGLFRKISFTSIWYTGMALQRYIIILPLLYLLFYKQIKGASPYRFILLILIPSCFLHQALTATTQFCRYEAYLIGCSVIITGLLFAKYGREIQFGKLLGAKALVGIFAGLILFFPIVLRSREAFRTIRRCCINVYEQQYQMGRFADTFYPHDAIAVNDIGAVSYFRDGTTIDLWGLGSTAIAKARKSGRWTPEFIEDYSKKEDVKLAIVFDTWISDQIGQPLLDNWQKVATWKIQQNITCGDSIVSFYAVKKELATDLRKHLVEYERSLPPGVTVSYYPKDSLSSAR